jgi:16S rRNA (cytidine1402-2'-O)-methyltransferase
MGTLYLVATPIGNLEDISARALRILSEVRLVAAEDTRHSRRLLEHYGIQTPLTSYHEHNKLAKLDRVLQALAEGDVALVSDAGTPGLNDPGYELVREVLAAGHPVSPIPGPSAPVSALVASGLPTDAFVYLGYLPRKAGERRRFLEEASSLPYTLIFLETPHRLLDALRDVHQVLGDRQAALGRELTKLHEEIVRGPVSQILEHFEQVPPRGEFTLVVAGKAREASGWSQEQVERALRAALDGGQPASQAAAQVAGQAGWNKRQVYRLALQISEEENT